MAIQDTRPHSLKPPCTTGVAQVVPPSDETIVKLPQEGNVSLHSTDESLAHTGMNLLGVSRVGKVVERPLHCTSVSLSLSLSLTPPLPPLGHIRDVILVWREGNINKTFSVLQCCAL